MTEREVQEQIVEALSLAGFEVRHTSAWRQKGPSGVSPGVPDLLVAHVAAPGSLLGIEVKRPGGRVSPAQKEWADLGFLCIADSPQAAVAAAVTWLKSSPSATVGAVRKADSVAKALEPTLG